MVAVAFSLLAALSNALAAVLQRHAARDAPREDLFRLALIVRLLHQPVWFGGMAAVVLGAVAQAAALATGRLALVQPLLVTELPFTLLISGLVLRRRLGPRPWIAVLFMTGGLSLALVAASPYGDVRTVPVGTWALGLIATGAFITVLLAASLRTPGAARAALLGMAAATGFAFTAALMKDASGRLAQGPGAFFSAWQLYVLVVTGVGSLFLLQNALQAGPLVASQPALTLGDSVVSVAYGVTLFGEHIRLGWYLLPELVGVALILIGGIELSRSPLVVGGGGEYEQAPRGRPRDAGDEADPRAEAEEHLGVTRYRP